ncbi:MAG: phytanoyl-CoA dioxygenase [Candidatus Latescibacteria bacterium]|nr:phytanoyl-CoA dioxygenase [Candidatus Latescibacterota bacterium]
MSKEGELTEGERRSLDNDGFVILYDVLTSAQVGALVERIQRVAATTQRDHTREAVVEPDLIKVVDLINGGQEFDIGYTHPRVLAAAHHVLGGDMKFHSMGSRSAPPGYGHQALHLDFGRDLGQPHPAGCNVLWTLVDFSRHNGGTRLVPGSHKSGQNPRQVLADPEAEVPGEIRLEAPAGSVVVFGGHTWHGGAQNHSEGVRWTLLSAFCKHDHAQDPPVAAMIDEELKGRLSKETHRLLDL